MLKPNPNSVTNLNQQHLFDNFFKAIATTELEPFEAEFRQALARRFFSRKHGDWPAWQQSYDDLPELEADQVDLTLATVTATSTASKPSNPESDKQRQQLKNALLGLHPWRKGPYNLFDVCIDTEWRSDWKWQRITPHIQSLDGRAVLDVGCGNGYHCWRMLGAGARFVLGVDPSAKFLVQFLMIKKYINNKPIYFLPLCSEDLPNKMHKFDTVFSMGILYHRPSPFEHLLELRNCLKPGGELVLETLVIDGDKNQVLVPPGRYAKMPNVWFLPSCDSMCSWLQRAGFSNIQVVDVSTTTIEEQRSTEWMHFESLADFLDPQNPSLTIEGLPAPTRAVFVATK